MSCVACTPVGSNKMSKLFSICCTPSLWEFLFTSAAARPPAAFNAITYVTRITYNGCYAGWGTNSRFSALFRWLLASTQ